jgi:tRNA (uracil-5-)-methyltransferase
MLDYRPEKYDELLEVKRDALRRRFGGLGVTSMEVFPSPGEAYRMRAEFRMWHEGEDLFYAMFDREQPKTPLRVESFPIASRRIQDAMPVLREALIGSAVLRRKLFQVEFLSTLSGELLISLIYHRPLDEAWESSARGLERLLQAAVIGRSRKQKCVLSRNYVEEELPLAMGTFRYRQYEQGFTQPNAVVNCAMVNWACAQAAGAVGDLLELYCGNGNFTLPLASRFDAVLATEVAKSSIQAALHNREINGVGNVAIARLSAEEVASALAGEREFRRLQALEKPLTDYRFSTVFVDPPRAGLDAATRALVSQFDRVLYISCNPETLHRDLEAISASHRIAAFALFDQFPYTEHMECGALLERR